MSSINSKNVSSNLFKNTGIIAIGQISTKIINFLLLPLYTSLLTKEEYGLIDLISTYATLLAVFVGLQLGTAIFRFLIPNRDDELKLKKLISTVICAVVLLCVIYSVGFVGVSSFIRISYKWFLLYLVLATVYLQVISGIVRGIGNNSLYAFGNFLAATITLVMNVISIAVLHLGVEAMLLAYVVGPILGASVILLLSGCYKYIDLKYFSFIEIKKILQYAIPLVPNELSWTLIHSSDRMIVSAIISVSANGLLAAASKFSYIYTTAFSIFNTSWTEQVVLHYKDEGGTEYISKMFDKMVTFFGSVGIGIVTCMPVAYNILINSQYRDGYGLGFYYVIAVFFNAIIGLISAIYLVENETKQIAISTAVAAIINIIVNLALIKFIGIYAAPISSICAYAIIGFWRLYDINRRHCSIKMKRRNVIVLLVMLMFSIFAYYQENIWINIINILVVAIVALCINYDLLKELARLIFERKK